MDDESKQLLREIRDLQQQQVDLLRTYLLPPWLRFRFSLRTLLIALTVVAIFMGIAAILANIRNNANRINTKKTTVVPTSPVRASNK